MTAGDGRAQIPGSVSVVLVNYRGADDTIACVRSLAELDWPAELLEVIVVENCSGDGSAERIRAAVGESVTVVESGANLGFAGGCNLGVEHATGEYVAFLNSDAKAHPSWVRAAVDVLRADSGVACVASKVLDWDGRLIDYVTAAMTWFGMGYKPEVEHPDTGAWDEDHDVLFGTGAAMLVRADVFRDVGGFDPDFFMFYEDVDLGWRLNLYGYRVRYVASSVAYHRHHAAMRKFGPYRETYLLERNALASMVKNYDDTTVATVLPAAMALSVRRAFARTDDRGAEVMAADDSVTVPVAKLGLTSTYAIDTLVDWLPSLLESRAEVQRRRVVSDREVFALFGQAMEPAMSHPRYLAGHDALVAAFGVEQRLRTRRAVVVLVGDRDGGSPSADGLAVARSCPTCALLDTLGRGNDVTVVAHGHGGADLCQRCAAAAAPARRAAATLAVAEVVVVVGAAPDAVATVPDGAVLILDRREPSSGDDAGLTARVDHVVVSSEQERSRWLGRLAAAGRLTAAVAATGGGARCMVSVGDSADAALGVIVRDLRTAPDRQPLPGIRPASAVARPRRSLRGDLQLARAYLQVGGPREVAGRVIARLRRVTADRRRA